MTKQPRYVDPQQCNKSCGKEHFHPKRFCSTLKTQYPSKKLPKDKMEEEVSAAHNQPKTSATKLGNKVFTTILDCYTIQLRGSQVREQVKKQRKQRCP